MEFSLRFTGGNFRPASFFSRRAARGGRHPSSRNASSSSAASSSGSSAGSYIERVRGFQGPWNAATTSGVLSAMGDALAQFLTNYMDEKAGKKGQAYDPWRTLRMFGFGFCWYGPYQYYWYNALDWMMPVRNTFNFLTKVTANQLLLAPCTLSAVFSWNLALTNQLERIPDKLKQDLMPTMMNGWKFWVPAASVNFYFIPVQLQVLYMSCCGLLWTSYLSYVSSAPHTPQPVEPEPEPVSKKGASKKKGKK